MSEARPKIHFAALVSVALDSEMLPWWIPHYQALLLDSYTVFLHTCGDPWRDKIAADLLRRERFIVQPLHPDAVKTCGTPGAPDGLRKSCMEFFSSISDENDFLITADADEFQEWRESPREAVARGVSVVLGRLVDCYDENLHAPLVHQTLANSYPYRAEDLASHFNSFRLNQKKICMAPMKYPLEYSGSHEPRPGASLPPGVVTGPIDVLHYRWRANALDRVRGRSYWPDAALEKMKEFFSVPEV